MKAALRILAAFMFAMIDVLPAVGQVPDQLKHSFFDPSTEPQAGAQLGYSVAVDGDYVIVGAPYNDIGGEDSGIVKVFDSTTGTLLFALPNPHAPVNGNFGSCVAISGARVVVGAPKNRIGDSDGSGSAFVYDLASATPAVPIATFINPTPLEDHAFGTSVGISGSRVVVGENVRQPDTQVGYAYVYDLDSATPTVPLFTLESIAAAVTDYTDTSVAISGARVVVGVTLDDSADDGGLPGAGRVYAYDLGSATPTVPVATFNEIGPPRDDAFGRALAISGTRIVVGNSRHKNPIGTEVPGIVYVYDLASGTPDTPVAELPNPVAGSHRGFGSTVAISGTRVVAGVPADNTGATAVGSAYLFDLSSATPIMPVSAMSNPSPATRDFFGDAVAVSDSRVVIGTPLDDLGALDAGSAYVYEFTSGIPVATLNNPGPAVNDRFGHSVAISGTLMVIGAPNDDTGAERSGSAYVYDVSSGTPTLPIFTLHNPTPASVYFGNSVAISGTRVVIGTLLARSAYVYDLSSSTPTIPVVTLNAPDPRRDLGFGTPIAISGARVLVGAPLSFAGVSSAFGRVYVYDLSSATPAVPVAVLNNPIGSSSGFGDSLAICDTRVVIGQPNYSYSGVVTKRGLGKVYVYDLSGISPTTPMITLDNHGPPGSDLFGYSVAISGARVVVGTPLDDTFAGNSGRAYVYDLGGSMPMIPILTLNNPFPQWDDQFGSSVAICGARVLVGAYPDDAGATDAGSAYVYDLRAPNPTFPITIPKRPSPAEGDGFSYSVAISETTVVIGAPYLYGEARDKGAAYVFGPSPYSLWKATEGGDDLAHDFSDADGDGLGTLAEYGLLRSPIVPDGEPFSATQFHYTEGERLRLFVPRDPLRNDITLEVQATGNLRGPWTTIATSVLGAPFSGPGYFGGDNGTLGLKSVEIRDVVNVTDSPQRFLRVRVRR